MKITIEGAQLTPSWETLQEVVIQCLKQSGRFVRIRRRDNGCHYRGCGVYDVEFIPDRGDAVQIELDVS